MSDQLKLARRDLPLAFFYQTIAVLLIYLFTSAHPSAHLHAQVISTFAGGGIGDTLQATNARLYGPYGMTLDAVGNLYIADYLEGVDYRIRRVATTGEISTVLGGGNRGSTGDGGPAANASYAASSSIALATDVAGNVYFTDGNERIRKIAGGTGSVSTVAGTGTAGFSGDGGPATSARISLGGGRLALARNGDLYFSDRNNQRVRRVSAATGIITTVAGNGTTGFSGDGGPAVNAQLYTFQGIAVDAADNVYIADSYNYRVRKVSGSTGIISTIAGNGVNASGGDGGPALQASISIPTEIAVDGSGAVYVFDYIQNSVRKIDGSTISTVMSSVLSMGLAVDASGVLYSTDFFTNSVVRGGAKQVVAGGGSCYTAGTSATNLCLKTLEGVAVDSIGNVYFSDSTSNRVYKVSAANGATTVFAGSGNRGFSGDGGAAASASLSGPAGISVDTQGNVFIADVANHRIRRVTALNGAISTVAGSGPVTTGSNAYSGDGGLATSARLAFPRSMTIDPDGNLLISDTGNRRIRKVNATTGVISTIGGNGPIGVSPPFNSTGDGGPATSAELSLTWGIVTDSSGNIYFAEGGQPFRVRKINKASGIIETVPGTLVIPVGSVLEMRGIAIDVQNNLYVTHQTGQVAQKISLSSGSVQTIAGNGSRGFSGDGGLATVSELANPLDVAVDKTGTLYITDSANSRIRKVSQPGPSNYSDLWWGGTAENGWGLSIQQHGNVQFNALYVYDGTGKPSWYVMPGGSWNANFSTYSGPIYQPTSAPLSNYNPAQFVVGASPGNLSITFTSNSTATLQYTINGISGQKSIQRQEFGGGTSPLAVGDMWWGGTAENGWGISIVQHAGILFGAWYTYGLDGKAAWYVQPSGTWSGNTYSGPFYSTTSSSWLGAQYNASQLAVTQVGNLSLNFTNADNAVMNYTFTSGPFTGTVQSKPLTRMSY